MGERAPLPLVTHDQLVRDLTDLGLVPGQTIMLHASVRAIGWIVGGPDVVLRALLDVLTPSGTLMMYISWEDTTETMPGWSPERQAVYLAYCPPFDPFRSRAKRDWSILTEYLRTWPGAMRSANPGASVAAVGARAEWITQDHPLQYGYGPGSPLDKLCQVGGHVLLLGAPLDTITLFHHAEHMARLPHKRTVRYQVPLLRDGRRVWVEVEEYDTGDGIVDWPGGEYFPAIAQEYIAAGRARIGQVGAARSHLFEAADLDRYAVEWMERHFAGLGDGAAE